MDRFLENSLTAHRKKLAELLSMPEPDDVFERGFHKGSIRHHEECIQHLERIEREEIRDEPQASARAAA